LTRFDFFVLLETINCSVKSAKKSPWLSTT
jgi:hypothetical protein